jgi:hypothetical protein
MGVSCLFRACLTILVFLTAPLLAAQTATIDFEALPDGAVTQVSGLQFTHAAIATAGISLDELEFPPHSGVKAAYDSGGPLTIAFSSPVTAFSAFFNYRTSLTVQAYDASGKLLATATSRYSSNLKTSGASGSAVNELLQVTAAGISTVVITGDPNGTSFTMDDVASSGSSTYLVGDTFPYTSDGIGNFGDGILNTLDLISALRAVTNLPGYVPATCSDRFDAMDAFPVDTAAQRGGDGKLNTLDLVETLKRAVNLDTSRPVRTSRGQCAAAPQGIGAQRVNEPVGVVIVGPPQNGLRAIYVQADIDLALAGFSVGVGIGQTQLTFSPTADLPPSVTDTALAGVLSAAWLNGLTLPAGQRVLLGSVAAGAGPVTLYGASGDTTAGRNATFRLQEVQPR